jgi:hypothetical protein
VLKSTYLPIRNCADRNNLLPELSFELSPTADELAEALAPFFVEELPAVTALPQFDQTGLGGAL